MRDVNNKLLLIILIVLLASVIRFYNFENRLTFGPEQAMSLISAGVNITDGISLLGQQLWRVTSEGHILFTSPIFGYTLIPLLLIFDFNPLPITVYFAIFNILTGIFLLFVGTKIFNFKVGFFGAILFLFNSVMIYHSMFIWIVNYMPLITLGIVFLLWLFYHHTINPNSKYKSFIFAFLIGMLVAINFGLDYSFLFSGILFAVVLFLISRNKIKDSLAFLTGAILGELPTIIFELRHKFYHLDSMWVYLLDTIKNPNQVGYAYYHSLHWYGLLFLIGGVVIYLIYKINKLLAVSLLVIYIFINLNSKDISFTRSVGMVEGMNLKVWEEAAETIANDNPPEKFEVTALLDFNSRAYPLRYLVKFKHGLTPMPIEDYKYPDANYVFAAKNYDFEKAIAWEIWVYNPFKVTKIKDINEFSVYKLTKDNENLD